jgi:serine/threonine-protein kinase
VRPDAERWARVQALFHEAAALPAAERRGFLDARAGGETALVEEVLALLAADTRGDSLLDRDLAGVAAEVLPSAEHGPLPREIGPYRLRERLGEGGMGVVHLAERTDLGSLVAIKFLRDAWASPARRERFVNEERLLAQLNHPFIARLYDADVLPDGTPWFAMEYVDGAPITVFCRERGSSVREKLELFRMVCEGVLHAHQLALIHRDLKPSNILVTRGGQPKLLDFGIARSLDAAEGGDPTRTGLHWLTPAYAAPEQFRGADLGVHTDIWALGVVLYELLAGRAPFDVEGKSPAEAERLVTDSVPPRPSTLAARGHESRGDWADLDVLCLTAMHRDTARRYRTVDSLIRDVDHFLHGEPLDARPDALGYRAAKFARRHRGALAAAAAVTITIAGLVLYYTAHLARARDVAVAEAERTRRIQAFMQGLFTGGDPDAGPQDSLRVVTLLARGTQEARALSGSPAIQSELYQTLGQIHQALGDFDQADRLLSKALEERRDRLGRDHPDVARSLIALAELRSWQSRFAEAESLARLGLERTRRFSRDDPAALARATTTLGIVLENKGDTEQAIAVLQEAARLDSIARLPANEATITLTELANSHFYAGNYAIADSLNHRLLATDRAMFGARHPRVAGDLINLGAIRQEMGDWPGAERHYRQAFEIYRGWYGENHFETASALNMIGRTLVQQHRLAEARAPLERALALRERIYGPMHPGVASTLNEVALLAQYSGRYADAEAAYRRMLAIYDRIYGGRHYLVGLVYSNLGSLSTERNDHRGAERFYRLGLAKYAEVLPAGHLYIGVTRLKLGRALLRQGRLVEAEQSTREGYDILTRQSEPPHSWLQNARWDLAQEYDRLGRPADAARFRDERARASADSAAAAAAPGEPGGH